MLKFSAKSFIILMCSAFISGTQEWTYADLEAMDVSCPSRDKCGGYRNNLTYMDRNCECDYHCTAYNDCCIDALPLRRPQNTRPPVKNNVKCINYGENAYSGVYVISKCSNSWSGPRQVREKCVGALDYSDPMSAAPVTDTNRALTYRNLFCAECNKANMQALQTFHFRMACSGLEQQLSEQQIWADLIYNSEFDAWGINRLNRFGNTTSFVGCTLIFDVPGYLNSSVRFCRPDLVSRCPPNYGRPAVKEACAHYMAVVYDNNLSYRNPHCAICNNRTVDQISCTVGLHSRKRPMSFALLLDVNQSDGDQVGMRRVTTPECPSGHKYDPFFKRCRQLVCALPGYVVVDGRCVKG